MNNERGASFGLVLLLLVAAVALYLGYSSLQNRTAEHSSGVTAIDASRSVACRSNRQTIERAVVAWSAMHEGDPSSLDALAADGVHLPHCPEGGTYSLVGREVRCTTHP